MQEYFFVFSGDGGTLARAELYALLETYGNPFSKAFGVDRFAVIRADSLKRAEKILQRGAYIIACCSHIASIKADDLQNLNISGIGSKIETFRVDCYDLANTGLSVATEGKIASIIKRLHPKLKVSMKNPDAVFVAVNRGDIISLGHSLAEKPQQKWEHRRPKLRPFFYAAALFPKFARCLVNLSRVRNGEILLDPFCGSGTILMEATLMGLDAVGIDILDKLCRGSLENLKALAEPRYSIIQGDARNMPLHNVGGIVTDIPYGRIAGITGHNNKELIEGFLAEAQDIMKHNGYAILVHPEPFSFSANGFSLVAQHRIRVHKSLTRVVAEYQRNS